MLNGLVLGGAVVTVGLMAGLFYSFSISVMPGLAGRSDAGFVATMQEINRKILNGWFLVAFLGAPMFLVAAILLNLSGTRPVVTVLIVAAAVAYLAGTFGVTAAVSVPLNYALDVVSTGASPEEMSRARDAFEERWNRWNDIRSISSVISLVLLVAASLASG